MKKIKMAYLLLAHKDAEQINIFIGQLLNYGDCDIYIHVDKKVEHIIEEINVNERVFIASKYSVSWGSFEIPKAALELMRIALDSERKYSHFYFGSCQDLLVKKGMYEFLADNPENIFIKITGPVGAHTRASARYRVRWPKKLMIRNDLHIYRFERIIIQYLCKIGIVYRRNLISISKDIKLYEGRTWFVAPYDVIKYIVNFTIENPEYTEFWKESLASDLMFFQTIIMNSPFRDKVKDELMYVNFGKTFITQNHPLDVRMIDDEEIKDRNVFFARKFNLTNRKDIEYYLSKTMR